MGHEGETGAGRGREPSVGVVLVNWNSGDLTPDCLRSLTEGTRLPDYVVVVDNGSSDGSPDAIAAGFPQATLLRNATNEGFAAATNSGIGWLLDREVDLIWVLNNDTIVDRDCLATLLESAQRHPDASALSCKIYYEGNRRLLWYAGARRHPVHGAPVHYRDCHLEEAFHGDAIPVDFISGCSMLVPARTLRRYGGFVESYVAYSEDSEWCWRVRAHGGQLLYVPGAVIWHKVSASVRRNAGTPEGTVLSPWALFLMNRNHLWTVRRHGGSLLRRGLLVVPNSLIQIRNAGWWLVNGEFQAARHALRGLLHGLLRQVPADVKRWPEQNE